MCKYLYQEIHIQSAHTSVSDLLPFEYAKPIEVNIDIMPHKQPFYVATTLFAINFLCSVKMSHDFMWQTVIAIRMQLYTSYLSMVQVLLFQATMAR